MKANKNAGKQWSAIKIIWVPIFCSLLLFPACTRSITTSTPPGNGAVINSDSIISGDIKDIRQETTGYPWEVDVLILSSQDVGNLPNPVKDKIGQVVTLKSETDMTGFRAGMKISARVKYVGDVPKPGISLLIYDIKQE